MAVRRVVTGMKLSHAWPAPGQEMQGQQLAKWKGAFEVRTAQRRRSVRTAVGYFVRPAHLSQSMMPKEQQF
jgi:hypothetical protein